MSRAVVVTGLGTAGAYGCGRAALERALAAGEVPAPAEIDRSGGYHRRPGARRLLLAPMTALAPWLPPAEARRMSPPSRLAVAAARMALAEAAIAPEEVAGPATAVVIATSFGPSSFSEALVRQVLTEGPEAASPYYFTESVANAAAAQIAISCAARGANLTLCQREAGALLALGRGAAEVAAGRADRALVGAVDEIAPLTHALLDRFGGLARRRPDRAEAAAARQGERAAGGGEVGRPFDRRRNGVVAAQGATVLLLETEEAAWRAGRRPLARILGWGSAFDPSAPPSGWGRGAAQLGRAMRRLLARCAPELAVDGKLTSREDGEGGSAIGGPATGVGASDGPATGVAAGDGPATGVSASDGPAIAALRAIDRIVSGAAGTRAGDRLEAQVLHAAWDGLPLPPVLVPKGVTGEYGGGFLGALVLAAAGAPFGPAAGFGEPDPALGLAPHDGGPLPAPRLLLASSLAAGGAAAWVVLGAP
jgi:3-oxoacyl-[acyl-carrier-protein] synthase II